MLRNRIFDDFFFFWEGGGGGLPPSGSAHELSPFHGLA